MIGEGGQVPVARVLAGQDGRHRLGRVVVDGGRPGVPGAFAREAAEGRVALCVERSVGLQERADGELVQDDENHRCALGHRHVRSGGVVGRQGHGRDERDEADDGQRQGSGEERLDDSPAQIGEREQERRDEREEQ